MSACEVIFQRSICLGKSARMATGIAMGALIGLLFSTAFVDNVSESRAMKAGYPEGYAAQVRRERVKKARARARQRR